jgi:hypothetical protein
METQGMFGNMKMEEGSEQEVGGKFFRREIFEAIRGAHPLMLGRNRQIGVVLQRGNPISEET